MLTLRRALFLLTLFSLLLSACGTQMPLSQSTDTPRESIAMPTDTTITGKFAPPKGHALLIIGQDTDSIDDYFAATNSAPGGVTGYTSLSKKEGIHETARYGSGPHNLDYLAETYPNSAIAVGLDMVSFLPQTASGKADEAIDFLLDALASYNRPVFVRFGYEFDGPWNHYDPEDYVAAWQHFHKRMQEKAVTNVALVWQSATWCDGTYSGHSIESWYPGDEYVDWVGLSYFVQAADCNGQPFEEMLAFAREHGKPLMIAESTPQRYKTGDLNFSYSGADFAPKTADETWNEWYTPFFQFIHDNDDVIRAVAYINANWDSQPMWGPPYRSGYWGDSRVQVNDLIKQRWFEEIGQSFWLNAGPGLFDELGCQK